MSETTLAAHETPAAPPVAGLVARGGVAVRLEDCLRRFGSVTALDHLTLDLEPGELVALLGPSGCGKTTALRALAGLERLDGGRVLVGGTDVTDTPTHRRGLGMVFQAYSLFPHLNALDNVAFGLRLKKVGGRERRRRAASLLELVGLAEQTARFPRELSGGQQQRVALARALAAEPRVLLLDEPLSALDAKVRAQLRDEIRRLQLEVGITTLFVTHDQDEALSIADRVGIMSSGRLQQIGTPPEVYEQPANAFVARFVGSVNCLRGEIVGERSVTVLGARLPLPLTARAMGPAVEVYLRPEAVSVRPDPLGTARVVSRSFLGSTMRIAVRLSSGEELQAAVASIEAAVLSVGSTVAVTPVGVPLFVSELGSAP